MSTITQYKIQHPVLFDNSKGLDIRPFYNRLTLYSQNMCRQFFKKNSLSEQRDSTRCHFEVFNAYDCVLRSRVGKSGRTDDNISLCRHHLDFMRKNLQREYGGDNLKVEFLVDEIRKLDRKPQIFI